MAKSEKMTKRQHLILWARKHGNWFYLVEVPFGELRMSKQSTSTALRSLCDQGALDFRVQGVKQYRTKG